MSRVQSQPILITIVILAVLFFISGLLHLLFRFLMKHRSSPSIPHSSRHPEMSESDAFRRQLQQLFHLHDSGLDQASIDALPVFLYKEIVGLQEPFDCAVCLCEFSQRDKLRLLPMCSHAFHIDCIEKWLLSNSTCPLCRGTIFTPGFSTGTAVHAFENVREGDGVSGNGPDGVSSGQKFVGGETVSEKRVFPVRLGKFRGSNGAEGEVKEKEEGETSSSSLGARRCFSMGSFQYVVTDLNLQVALCHTPAAAGAASSIVVNGNSSIGGDSEGKKISTRMKGESFSVSKIWLWSKKGGELPSSADAHFNACSVNVNLALPSRTQMT